MEFELTELGYLLQLEKKKNDNKLLDKKRKK